MWLVREDKIGSWSQKGTTDIPHFLVSTDVPLSLMSTDLHNSLLTGDDVWIQSR